MAFPGLDVKWGGLVKKHTTISPVTFLKSRWVQNWHWNSTQNENLSPIRRRKSNSIIRQQLLKSLSSCIFHARNVCCFLCKIHISRYLRIGDFFSELTREQIVICEADTDCSSQSIQILFLCLKVIYKTALMGQNMLFEAHLILHFMFKGNL